MALIKCSECQKEISDKAVNCPNCGNPISGSTVVKIETDFDKPLKIEPILTSKKWKRAKLWSWIAIIFGFILMGQSGGTFAFDNITFNIGFCFVGYGFIALIVGKIGAWYEDRGAR